MYEWLHLNHFDEMALWQGDPSSISSRWQACNCHKHLRLTYISLPSCWKFQLQSFSLKSQPLESQPIAKVCQNGHLLVMQPLSHGKENGEATGLVASAWNQQLGRSKGGKSHQAARQGLIVSPCTMVRWGEADDSLRLRYAAPTRLILRRPLVRIRKRYRKIVMEI